MSTTEHMTAAEKGTASRAVWLHELAAHNEAAQDRGAALGVFRAAQDALRATSEAWEASQARLQAVRTEHWAQMDDMTEADKVAFRAAYTQPS